MYQKLKKLLVKTSGFGAPLLLLHGWGMNSTAWKPVLNALESRYQIHRVDLPGHGFNSDVEAESMQEIVGQIADLIDQLNEGNTTKVHILGWSLGGLIAQAFADQFPGKIISMTLVASTLRFSQDDAADSLWPHAMSLKILNNFAINLKNDMEGTLKRFIALQFMGIPSSKEIQRELMNSICPPEKVAESRGVTKEVTLSSLDLGLRLLAESDFRNSDSQHPQHWIFAEKDRLIPKNVINDLISLRSDAQITLLKNAGHAPFMTHPDEFISHVSSFIDSPV